LRQRIPAFAEGKAALSVHCHNDCGLALANTLTAVEAGCGQVEATVCGFGERAGNAALEEIAVNLYGHPELYGVVAGLRFPALAELQRLACRAAGRPAGPQKPLGGWNVRAHASGIHQKGVSLAPDSYSPAYLPLFGTAPERVALSRHSGRAGVRMMAQARGLGEISDEAAEALSQEIKKAEARSFGATEFLLLAERSGFFPPGAAPPLWLRSSSEWDIDRYSRLMATLSDGRTVVGEGAAPAEAALRATAKISGFALRFSRMEFIGADRGFRLYAEIALPGGGTLATERGGPLPGRLLFESCLDAVNCLNLREQRKAAAHALRA
jgi:2-isopropylmalate synthase